MRPSKFYNFFYLHIIIMYENEFIQSKLNLYKIVRFHSNKYARVTGGCKTHLIQHS